MTSTYLVIPDKLDGGEAYEMVALADTPEEACRYVADYFHSNDIERFEEDADSMPGEHWTVRELKGAFPKGVVDWSRIKCTFWVAVRKEESFA